MRAAAAVGASVYSAECARRGVATALRRLRRLAARLGASPLRRANLSAYRAGPWEGGTGAASALVAVTGGGDGADRGWAAAEDAWPNVAADALAAALAQHWEGRRSCLWGGLSQRLEAARAAAGADASAAVRACWEEAERAAREELILVREVTGLDGGSRPKGATRTRGAAERASGAGERASGAGGRVSGAQDAAVAQDESGAAAGPEAAVLASALRFAGEAVGDTLRQLLAVWGSAGDGDGGEAATERLCAVAVTLREEAEARSAPAGPASGGAAPAPPDEDPAVAGVVAGSRSAAAAVRERIEFVVYAAVLPGLGRQRSAGGHAGDQGAAGGAAPSLSGPRYPEALLARYAPQLGASERDLLLGPASEPAEGQAASPKAPAAAAPAGSSGAADGAAEEAASAAAPAAAAAVPAPSPPARIRVRSCHPALDATRLLLSRLFRVYDASSLARIGADVVRRCVDELREAAAAIAALPPLPEEEATGASLGRRVDASLFLCAHLLELREALAPLGLDAVRPGGDSARGGDDGAAADAAPDGSGGDRASGGDDADTVLGSATSGLWAAVAALVGADDDAAAAAASRRHARPAAGQARPAALVMQALSAACDRLVTDCTAAMAGRALPLARHTGSTPVSALSVAHRETHEAALEEAERSCAVLAARFRLRVFLYLPSASTGALLWRAVREGVVRVLVRWRSTLQATAASATDQGDVAWAAGISSRIAAVVVAVDAAGEPRD